MMREAKQLENKRDVEQEPENGFVRPPKATPLTTAVG